jgi:hypothetical protein
VGPHLTSVKIFPVEKHYNAIEEEEEEELNHLL